MKIDYKSLECLYEKYGESFYILDSSIFSKNYDEFLSEFKKFYPKSNIGYSYKTNYAPIFCKIVKEKGGFAEVVSNMEYEHAENIGVITENIIVNGPYKSQEELKKYFSNGSIVNIDSFSEFEKIEKLASENKSIKFGIGIRCNFDIGKSYVSRFGIDVDSEKFNSILYSINNIDNLSLRGVHSHFPDRDLESYSSRVKCLLKLLDRLKDINLEYIDIGGGYFGKMSESLKSQFSVKVPSYNEYAEITAKAISNFYANFPESKKPLLFLEPGSALVADSMKFVAKIIDIKNIRGKSIAMSTGSRFNIGLISSQVNMPLSVIEKKCSTGNYYKDIDISGYTCIESDYLYRGYNGKLDIGDYIIFDNVGSYSIVFKPPFIMPNVPIIDISEDNYMCLIKRIETTEDIFKTYT